MDNFQKKLNKVVVRIRPEALRVASKPSKQFGGFFMTNFQEKLNKVVVRIRPEASGVASKRDTEMCLFFYG